MSPIPPTTFGSSSVNDIKSLSINEDEEDTYHRDYVTSRIRHYDKVITKSRRLASPQRRRAMSIIKSYKTQLSGSSSRCEEYPEGISEDSPYVKGTTLLKSVPHKGIYRDEEDYIPRD